MDGHQIFSKKKSKLTITIKWTKEQMWRTTKESKDEQEEIHKIARISANGNALNEKGEPARQWASISR